MIPHIRHLFKAINSLYKTTNMRQSIRVDETGRLLYENFFDKIPLKKKTFLTSS